MRVPTEEEVAEFKERLSKSYDDEAAYEEQMNEAIDKGNASMYKDVNQRRERCIQEREAAIQEWDKKYGYEQQQEEQQNEEQQTEQQEGQEQDEQQEAECEEDNSK